MIPARNLVGARLKCCVGYTREVVGLTVLLEFNEVPESYFGSIDT
jgi:hypothetical protein